MKRIKPLVEYAIDKEGNIWARSKCSLSGSYVYVIIRKKNEKG